MTRSLRRRRVVVRIGSPGSAGVEVDGLHVAGEIEIVDRRAPNTAVVAIYNAGEQVRSALTQEGATIEVIAGYVGDERSLFLGDVGEVMNASERPDWITTVQADDGRRGMRTRVRLAFDSGSSIETAVRRVCTLAGLPLGRFSPALEGAQFVSPWSFVGECRRALDELARSAGASWQVLRGAVVFGVTGEQVERLAQVYAPDTGLIGSPEVTDDGVSVQVTLDGRIAPGTLFRVESRFVTGWFRAFRVTHVFDSGFGDAWVTSIDAREVRA